MNRNFVIGGVVAVAILLGIAAWFLLSGRSTITPGSEVAGEPAGPIALNNVTVVTDHSASESEDGRTLNVTFPKFELNAKGGETTSAVFSTTWRLKMAPEERALVASVSIGGYMKSAGTPPAPVAAPAPTTTTTPAVAEGTTPATPAAEGTTPPAEQPAAAPAPAAPAKPVAGDGVARVIVSIGGEISVTEWKDWSGEGAQQKVSKAVAFASGASDLRDGATVPVTVTVEVFGGTATETLAKLNALDLRVFAENAPLPSAAPSAAVTETPAAPAEVTPPAEGTTPPAEGATTPPAETTTTTPPAEGTTPPQ